MTQDYPVIVSIDFGTTYSGCCYALADTAEVHDIFRWPKSNGFYAKVPSLLYYKKNGRLLDWGKGARLQSLRPDNDGTLLQYFKLALITEEIRLPDNKTHVDVIADYLRMFHDHIYEQLLKTQLLHAYKQCQYRYCLTVPAIWSDQSKALMREAMVQAGILQEDDPIHRLALISEPEAAAAYCENKYQSWNLSDGDIFMIVDAGGGTVDLITYLIQDATPPRTLSEVTRGNGAMCGSAFIDQNMSLLLRSKLSNGDIPSCMFEMMMDTFIETIKPNYRGDETDVYLIPVPAGALQYIQPEFLNDDHQLIFRPTELRDLVFHPVLKRVVQLVREQLAQVDQYVQAIFLVGGFGCSEYLYDILREKFHGLVGEIAMPPRGELAVAQGAVYHLLKPNLVTSKLLRRTYGVRTRLPFEQGLDPESSAVITKDGIKRCSTRFDVIAHKGQRVFIDQSIKRSFWVVYPKHTEADLYASDSDVIPRQVTDKDSVVKLAELPIKMPLLPNVKPGTRMDVTIEFIFGMTEIKMVVHLAGTITEHLIESHV
ncbi:uncharacterized protein EV154DRAFT_527851 [Mucor mucedo]|uniref:uncharacterized protein n=1 Tax=Mucor mucedo TaxID=29922 RepID=UPI00221ED4E4|nr:uncharacterized protein EV154DRAFT_527851 [Mucor mucedo]KAI7873614.1 hypothetical protein EV154DRAFT_527851 [Mucor mucedo]